MAYLESVLLSNITFITRLQIYTNLALEQYLRGGRRIPRQLQYYTRQEHVAEPREVWSIGVGIGEESKCPKLSFSEGLGVRNPLPFPLSNISAP